jgi:hypothetical protein
MDPEQKPVGGSDRSRLKLAGGLLVALVVFVPFGILAGVLWGWWWHDDGSNLWGWVITLLGLAGAVSMGSFVAYERRPGKS